MQLRKTIQFILAKVIRAIVLRNKDARESQSLSRYSLILSIYTRVAIAHYSKGATYTMGKPLFTFASFLDWRNNRLSLEIPASAYVFFIIDNLNIFTNIYFL